MGLWYPKDTGFELTAFSDSDHAGCLDSRKSTSGGIQFLGGDKLVSWSSKKQDCTLMSSAEAGLCLYLRLRSSSMVENQAHRLMAFTLIKYICIVPQSSHSHLSSGNENLRCVVLFFICVEDPTLEIKTLVKLGDACFEILRGMDLQSIVFYTIKCGTWRFDERMSIVVKSTKLIKESQIKMIPSQGDDGQDNDLKSSSQKIKVLQMRCSGCHKGMKKQSHDSSKRQFLSVFGHLSSFLKSVFFLIDWRAIPDCMVWRHPRAAIDDLRPAAGSFSMADVCWLSAHVIKLKDMPTGVLVLSGLSRVWKIHVFMGIHDFLCLPEWTGSEVQEEPHHDIRPTLQRLPFYCTPPTAVDTVILDPTPADLAASTPNAKVLAKAKASQKSALDQSSGSTTRPSLFMGDDDGSDDDDDDDACVEILLVTPLRSAAVIPSLGNQGGSSATPAAEDSRGKGIMADDVAAPFVGVNLPRPSSSTTPSFRTSLEMLFMRTSSPFLMVLIMPPTLKVVLLGIASLLTRSGMLRTGLLLGF
ncbi:hypothetical protein Tco_0957076 [Tanacetum coccineum]